MTSALNRLSVRTSTAAVIAAIGLFGLVGCSSGGTPAAEEPTTTSPSSEPETTEEAPASDGSKCTEEQVATLNSLSGIAIPQEVWASAKASFEPAAIIGDLPTTCVLTFDSAAGVGSYAVLPGGAATLTTAAANATAAGAEVAEAGGTFTGTMDGLTIAGVAFTQLTQETAGFENVEDLVVIVSTGLLG